MPGVKTSCANAVAPPVDWAIVELAVVDLCDARVVEALPKALLALPGALATGLASLPGNCVSEEEIPATVMASDAAADTKPEPRLEITAGIVDAGATETNVAAPAADSETEEMSDVTGETTAAVVITAELDTGGEGAALETGGGSGAEDVDTGGGGAATTDVDAAGAAPAMFTTIAIPASAGFRLLVFWKPSTSKI